MSTLELGQIHADPSTGRLTPLVDMAPLVAALKAEITRELLPEIMRAILGQVRGIVGEAPRVTVTAPATPPAPQVTVTPLIEIEAPELTIELPGMDRLERQMIGFASKLDQIIKELQRPVTRSVTRDQNGLISEIVETR